MLYLAVLMISRVSNAPGISLFENSCGTFVRWILGETFTANLWRIEWEERNESICDSYNLLDKNYDHSFITLLRFAQNDPQIMYCKDTIWNFR